MSEILDVGTDSAQPADESEANATHQPTATHVTGQLPAEAFALSETFRAIPDLTVRCAPFAAAGKAASMPLMWAQTDETDLTSTLAQDQTVTAIEELFRTGDQHLYRMKWTDDIHCRMEILLQSRGILRRSWGTDSEWTVNLIYPDRDTLRQANKCWEQYNLPLQVDSIISSPPDQQSQCGLTQVQHRSLIQACEQGYFQVPRKIGLNELAEKMNISHQALSERLRRGHNTLIEATLLNPSSTPSAVSPSCHPYR